VITIEQAKELRFNQVIYAHELPRLSDGKPTRARVCGVIKLWKRRPDYFEVPMKIGIRTHFRLTPHNADHWYLTE